VSEAVPPTVLYAPTWKGHYADTDFCSLPVAADLVTRLVARGATVILRPHPFSRKHAESAAQLARAEEILAADAAASGRQHLYGEAASADVALFECFDRSDAMICDVSSVASDYLFSGKPFAVTDMTTAGDGDFAEIFPLARAAYVLHPGGHDTDRVLELLLGEDPLSGARGEARRYYLGDFPAEGYAEGFLAAARAVVSDEGHTGTRGTGPGAEAEEQAEEEAEWLAEVDQEV
jgi:hypothetical protein